MKHSEKFKESGKQLNLQLNGQGIYEYWRRIQGVYSIYLTSSSTLKEKIISLQKELTWGVISTMAEVRSLFWIPTLRKLTKFVSQIFHTCKRFRAIHYPNRKLGLLPRYRTEQVLPFEFKGTDYADPLYY